VRSILADTSVLIKWFHAENESELAQARELRTAHLTGRIEVRYLDLARYELGNVLLRALKWPAARVADQLDDLVAICAAPISPTVEWLRDATTLGARHNLTFYDATWAASARALGVTLVSADRKLLGAGLAESATSAVGRLLS